MSPQRKWPLFFGGLLLPLLLSCQGDEIPRFWFNGPEAAAILPAGGESPFKEPAGFVVNVRDGTILPLDLKHGILLGDQAAAPYLPPRMVATGDERQLGQVAVWANEGRVSVFAGDYANEVLVEAVYVDALDEMGEPQPPPLTASEPVFVDADDSGDNARLVDLELRHGYTTTESWVFEYDGSEWSATGSRSGRQTNTFDFGEDARTDRRELDFRIEGRASAGDRIELVVDAEVEEHSIGGYVMGLHQLEGTDLLLVGVYDAEADRGQLVLWDLPTRTVSARLDLGEGAQPWRFAIDGFTGTLYIADARLPVVHLVDLDLEAPGSSTLDALTLPAPASAIAWVGQEENGLLGDEAYGHLFVAPTGLNRVDVWDSFEDRWIDVNPFDEVLGGVSLDSPVVGLSASTERVKLQSTNNEGVRDDSQVVMVTTFDGSVRIFEGETGCLAIEPQGPRIPFDASTNAEAILFQDEPPVGRNERRLYRDEATLSSIVPHPCGGVLKSEEWTVTYDEIQGNWRVEGTRSGEQVGRAWENERYITDDGAMSFIILSELEPPSEGDRFEFETASGVLRINEVERTNVGLVPLELPAAPLIFNMEAGPTGGGWDEDRTQIHALVPVTASDFVLRIRLNAWKVEVLYE